MASLNDALQKYHHPAIDVVKQKGISLESIFNFDKRATANEKLIDQVEQGSDLLYYGSFKVGSQTFTADFDTGSSDLFVPGPKCTPAKGCKAGTTYNQHGQDQKRTTSVTYGSGAITGEDYFDTVSVAGLSATHTNVISLTSAQGFNSSKSNSLLGMGFSQIANSKQPTFFENLISQKKVTTPEFSFYLGRASSGTNGGSELTLGGRDTSKFTGAVTKVPVTKKGYWQVKVDGAVANGHKVLGTAGQAAIDTGTTIILAPTAAATAIFAAIGGFPVPLASGDLTTTIYAYPCNFKGTISLTFAGKNFKINNKDLSLGSLTASFAELIGSNPLSTLLDDVMGGGLCAGAIAGADLDPTQNLYVVGDTFLKNWYSIYNYNGAGSVSFAAAKGNNP